MRVIAKLTAAQQPGPAPAPWSANGRRQPRASVAMGALNRRELVASGFSGLALLDASQQAPGANGAWSLGQVGRIYNCE